MQTFSLALLERFSTWWTKRLSIRGRGFGPQKCRRYIAKKIHVNIYMPRNSFRSWIPSSTTVGVWPIWWRSETIAEYRYIVRGTEDGAVLQSIGVLRRVVRQLQPFPSIFLLLTSTKPGRLSAPSDRRSATRATAALELRRLHRFFFRSTTWQLRQPNRQQPLQPPPYRTFSRLERRFA